MDKMEKNNIIVYLKVKIMILKPLIPPTTKNAIIQLILLEIFHSFFIFDYTLIKLEF